jgi:hypothetical protein
MSFTLLHCQQRSDEWRQARAGRLTGSNAHCVTAKGKGGEALTRRDLRYRIALERITGRQEADDYLSFDMRRGIDLEPQAIAAYSAFTAVEVLRTGFISSNSLPIGCSLDGHVADFSAIIEIKCSKSALHIKHWLHRDEFVHENWQQIAHNLWVTGAKSCDLVSFNPTVPSRLRLLRVEVPRSAARIPEYIEAAERFLLDVDSTVREIEALAEAAVITTEKL